ncbi:hypothetical protein [Pseudomonas sp.]|uniref:hypothetical protein n=1 Tax=Pseudomonas sp. TaxID=306 RepID=UPI00258A3D2D|nr:hypothetical protein [Pseudomonas sp.]
MKPTYWPDTRVIKSTHNAFNWREGQSVIANNPANKRSAISSAQMSGASALVELRFHVYSKAKASK